MKVCFQLPGDRYYQNFDERPSFSEIVELEISLNDVLCEAFERKLTESRKPLRVCSLEDILAEKLRALLQQLIRGRNRPQDVYDVASRMRERGGKVDVEKVTRHRAEEELLRRRGAGVRVPRTTTRKSRRRRPRSSPSTKRGARFSRSSVA